MRLFKRKKNIEWNQRIGEQMAFPFFKTCPRPRQETKEGSAKILNERQNGTKIRQHLASRCGVYTWRRGAGPFSNTWEQLESAGADVTRRHRGTVGEPGSGRVGAGGGGGCLSACILLALAHPCSCVYSAHTHTHTERQKHEIREAAAADLDPVFTWKQHEPFQNQPAYWAQHRG